MNFSDLWGLALVEGSILVAALIMILFVRRALHFLPPKKVKALSNSKKNLETNLEKINQLLKESETLSSGLASNLTEKGEMVKKLIETLDEKIQGLNQWVEKVERHFPATSPGAKGKDGNGEIVEMALAGCGVADIAKRLGLSKEEVQLILDLRKIAAS